MTERYKGGRATNVLESHVSLDLIRHLTLSQQEYFPDKVLVFGQESLLNPSVRSGIASESKSSVRANECIMVGRCVASYLNLPLV